MKSYESWVEDVVTVVAPSGVPVCHSGEWRAHMALKRSDAEQEAAILTFLAISIVTVLLACMSVVI